SAPRLDAYGIQRKIRFAKTFSLADVRRVEQSPIERVSPMMIWAPNDIRSEHPVVPMQAFGLVLAAWFAKPRPPVSADVVMRPQLPRLGSNDEDALSGRVQHHKVSRIGQLLLPPGAQPFLAEDVLF